MSLGERIVILRSEAGLSQDSLARLAGVSRQAISKWENDLSSPDTIHLIKLADILNTEVEYLATGKKPVYEHPIVVNMVKTQDKIVKVEKVVEKPVIKRVIRTKYRRNPLEFFAVGFVFFVIGFIFGLLL